MAKRRQGRRVYPDRRLYRETFMLNPQLRERIGVILDLGVDPGPATGCAELESALTALVAGEAEPVDITSQLNGVTERTVGQLFYLRDAAS